jgi:hypothetical protein
MGANKTESRSGSRPPLTNDLPCAGRLQGSIRMGKLKLTVILTTNFLHRRRLNPRSPWPWAIYSSDGGHDGDPLWCARSRPEIRRAVRRWDINAACVKKVLANTEPSTHGGRAAILFGRAQSTIGAQCRLVTAPDLKHLKNHGLVEEPSHFGPALCASQDSG